MAKSIELRIGEILADADLDMASRIEKLEQMRLDARAEQRAATEGGMVADDGATDDLRTIDLVIQRLGSESMSDEEEDSPATL